MNRRLVIVPRWAGRPSSDCYPWLVETLAAMQPAPFAEVVVCDLPDPGTPRLDTWPPGVAAVLGVDPGLLARTFVLAHSVGCQATLHAIAALPDGSRLAGMLAVAGWWHVDKPWPSILPWQDTLPDLARVRAALTNVTLLISDNDPFTTDFAANAALWRERLAADVEVVPHAKHFNGVQEPAVLTALLRAAH